MRENRPYGSEGGEAKSLPYPYHLCLTLRPGPPQCLRNTQHRNVPARRGIECVAQQRGRASIGARRRPHVMGIEDQPAILGDGLIERAVDLLAVDFHFDQGGCAQILQIHDAAVDAGKNTAHRAEDLAELPLVRHRAKSIRISKIFDFDRGIERRKITAVLARLRHHRLGIEIDGAGVRDRMAGQFMATSMQAQNVIGADAGPVAGPPIDQAAGDIEGAARTVLLEQGSADGGGTLGSVVEGEADHRAIARQPKWLGKEMSRQPVADARSEVRPDRAHGKTCFRNGGGLHLHAVRSSPCPVTTPERYRSQFRNIAVAAAPVARSGRRIRPGSSTLSGSLRSALARFWKLASFFSVQTSK